MKYSSKLFWENPLIKITSIVSCAILIIGFFLIFSTIKPTKDLVTLRYSIYFGIDLVGFWWQAYTIPLIGLIVFILNIIIGITLFLKSKILSEILAITNLFSQIIIAIICFLIVLLN